jgi:hypothetical protein
MVVSRLPLELWCAITEFNLPEEVARVRTVHKGLHTEVPAASSGEQEHYLWRQFSDSVVYTQGLVRVGVICALVGLGVLMSLASYVLAQPWCSETDTRALVGVVLTGYTCLSIGLLDVLHESSRISYVAPVGRQ